MSGTEQELQAQLVLLRECVASLIALVADDERARIGKPRLLSDEQRAKIESVLMDGEE